ncbi:Protein MAM-1 [Aphelenchoides avenae]|nr:Protein MAM-1 [Aphelenchus avenae]
MVLPSEPFTLIEVRGRPSDMLASDLIHCQKDSALFSFTYWTVGNADLEICLMDKQMRQFNCTGMLHSHIQPGKVALKIPPIQHPFHIAIIPDSTTGIIVVDDIKPVFPTTTTEPPFDLLIIGNKTKPLFDRRRGKIIDDVSDLLCDFAFDYPCFWGPEAGKWAVIQKGAIPSLEESLASHAALPAFPAAVVIQGNAMLTSDPVRCQSGEGKLLFRYWTNGEVMLQACALGYNLDSEKVQCVDQLVKATAVDESTLAVFELASPIPEPFTLNIVPVWSSDSRNRYLIIDEIA